MTSLSSAFPLAFQVPSDTVLFVATDGLARWADVATIVLAIAVILTAVVAAWTMIRLQRLMVAANRLLSDMRRQVDPVVDRTKVVADNLGYVSAMVRRDVERLSSTVSGLTGRLNQASDRMEERIEEFNALLEVAQSEAENLFLDTASTVRAVQASARTLGRGPEPAPGDDEHEETGP